MAQIFYKGIKIDKSVAGATLTIASRNILYKNFDKSKFVNFEFINIFLVKNLNHMV